MAVASTLTNPYLHSAGTNYPAATTFHNGRTLRLRRSVRNWQIIAGGLRLTTLSLTGAGVVTSTQPVAPSSIEVDAAGGAAAIKELQPRTALDPLVIAAQRKQFLTETRTLSTTDELVCQPMNAAYQQCLAPAHAGNMTYWRRLLVPTRTHSCRRCESAAWAEHVSPQRSDTWNRRYCAIGTGRGRRINMDRPDTNTPHRRDWGAGGRRRRTPEHPHGAGSRTTQHTPAVITDAELEAWRAMTAADTQLRETLLGLPSMIGLVLHVAHKKQLAKILDEADAATHGALERHLLALHAYLREWAALETTAHMRAQIADEVASLLAPFAFSRGFLLQAAQALTAPPRDPSLQIAPEVQATAVQRVTAARATLAQAVETLVLLHLPFVERFSRSFVAVYRRYGRHLEPTDQLDLFQEGCVGLLRAAWRYNPQHNTRFWTYARHWVHQALGRLVPKLGAVVVTPERVRAQHKTIARTKQRLSTFLDRDPDARELALALGLPLSQGRLTADLPPRCISTETPIGDGELTLGDVLIDPQGEEWLIQLEHEDGGEDDQ